MKLKFILSLCEIYELENRSVKIAQIEIRFKFQLMCTYKLN